MKMIFIVLLLFLSCSHKKTINPNKVHQILKEDMHLCLFVDDLKIEKDNLSEIKFHEEIRMFAASRDSNAYVIDELIVNGTKKKALGSLMKCSSF